MRKIKLSLLAAIAAATMVTTGAQASDNTALTKAVVKLIKEQKGLSDEFTNVQNQINKFQAEINKANTAYNNAANENKALSDKIKLLEDKSNQANLKSGATKAELQNLNSQGLADIKLENTKLKGEIEQLKAEMKTMKTVQETELKVVKTKLETAKPVVMVQEKEQIVKKCSGKECDEINEADAIIQGFLK